MSDRAGFALAELLVALVVVTVVAGAIHDGLRRQQRLFRSIALMVSVRADARDAVEVLAAELSSASPQDTLRVATDSAVEFFGIAGTSVTCHGDPDYTVRLPPEKLASGVRLTTLLATPDSGDLLLIYNDDTSATGGAPRWDSHRIAAVGTQPAGTACPASTGFTTAADAGAPSTVLTLRSDVSSGVRAGAPVRILRRVRYSLYRSSDAHWYLGSRRCNSLGPSVCGGIQPLSGPYASYSAGAGKSGIHLRYRDPTGGIISSPSVASNVASITVAVRARSRVPVQVGGSVPAAFLDSATVTIGLRNRD